MLTTNALHHADGIFDGVFFPSSFTFVLSSRLKYGVCVIFPQLPINFNHIYSVYRRLTANFARSQKR